MVSPLVSLVCSASVESVALEIESSLVEVLVYILFVVIGLIFLWSYSLYTKVLQLAKV